MTAIPAPAPAPGFRIERAGNLFVYIPVKVPWWAPHDNKDCGVFTAPRADCDCSADLW